MTRKLFVVRMDRGEGAGDPEIGRLGYSAVTPLRGPRFGGLVGRGSAVI